jgi:hypothetical protein
MFWWLRSGSGTAWLLYTVVGLVTLHWTHVDEKLGIVIGLTLWERFKDLATKSTNPSINTASIKGRKRRMQGGHTNRKMTIKASAWTGYCIRLHLTFITTVYASNQALLVHLTLQDRKTARPSRTGGSFNNGFLTRSMGPCKKIRRRPTQEWMKKCDGNVSYRSKGGRLRMANSVLMCDYVWRLNKRSRLPRTPKLGKEIEEKLMARSGDDLFVASGQCQPDYTLGFSN